MSSHELHGIQQERCEGMQVMQVSEDLFRVHHTSPKRIPGSESLEWLECLEWRSPSYSESCPVDECGRYEIAGNWRAAQHAQAEPAHGEYECTEPPITAELQRQRLHSLNHRPVIAGNVGQRNTQSALRQNRQVGNFAFIPADRRLFSNGEDSIGSGDNEHEGPNSQDETYRSPVRRRARSCHSSPNECRRAFASTSNGTDGSQRSHLSCRLGPQNSGLWSSSRLGVRTHWSNSSRLWSS